MSKIVFDFDVEGALHADPYLDQVTLNYLFAQTKESIGKGIERKLSNLTCAEHGEEPTITITGTYSGSAEQLDISYHIDTCCQIFMAQVIKTLNAIN
ncbi:MAG: hypothetical protein AAFV98_01130 [Chloroflexota bacterium]